jgi:transcriptional regulator with XRE-family HTH domain
MHVHKLALATMQTADGPPTRAQRFAAVVVPAIRRAGYSGHGSNARLSRATGIPEATVSRMLNGKMIPDPGSFQALGQAIDMTVPELFAAASYISPDALSEISRSHVRSQPVTVEDAADALDIRDPVGREMFAAMVERLRRQEADRTPDADDHNGGTAAER